MRTTFRSMLYLASVLGAAAIFARLYIVCKVPSSVEKLGSQSRTSPTDVSPSQKIFKPLEEALENSDYATAEAIVAANISGPYGNGLHWYHAALLAHRGDDQEALSEYMSLLHGKYGRQSVNSRLLTPALEIAVKLRHSAEVDEIAERICVEPGWSFSSFEELNPLHQANNSHQRLAFAYLVLAHNSNWRGSYKEEVKWCEKAYDLEPNDVPVIVQLANAYRDRRLDGDGKKVQALLRRAYFLLPYGSIARSEMRIHASERGVVFSDAESGRSYREDFDAVTAAMDAKRSARTAAKKVRKVPFTP